LLLKGERKREEKEKKGEDKKRRGEERRGLQFTFLAMPLLLCLFIWGTKFDAPLERIL